MPRYLFGFVLSLVFVVTLVVNAPARLLGLFLPGDQVVMQGFEGSLWRGSASRTLLRTEVGYLHLGAVQWSLHPLSLVFFAPRLSLASTWGGQTITGDVVLRGSRDLDFHALDARVSADLVRQFVPLELGGTFSLQAQELQLREGLPVSGSGRLVWQGGSWKSPQGSLTLGTYALDFQQPRGDALEAQVVTVSGLVSASGTVRLQDGAYALDILVSSKGALDAQLQQALSLIATPVAQGHRLELQGEL